MSFYICVFSNIFAKQIYSFINAQGQIKILSPDPFVAKYFFLCVSVPFYHSNMRNRRLKYTAANVWENEHGRKEGGGQGNFERVSRKLFSSI